MPKVRFDESLPKLASVLSQFLSKDDIANAVIVRDVSGRLAVVLNREADDSLISSLSGAIREALGGYARSDTTVRDRGAFGSESLLNEGNLLNPFFSGGHSLRVLDRRAVGADWLSPPVATAAGIPRITFASLKGGVGRSTALAVSASHLSAQGKRVLAIDLDLEAPGIGTLLIEPAALPQYGSLDYLLENGVTGIDQDFLLNIVGKSFLGANGGQVSVIPAMGQSTMDNPANALGKISRAYVEDVTDKGTISFANQVRSLVDDASASGDYDVILIDARAGLHETTAAAIQALGGDVLLFGIDEPQTFLGYRLLLSHLSQFSIDQADDWRSRLQFVQAKASSDPSAQADAATRFSQLSSILYPNNIQISEPDVNFSQDDFDLEWSDDPIDELLPDTGPEPLINILDDSRFREFNPILNRELLSSSVFISTFGSLTSWLDLVTNVGGFDDGD